MLSENAKDIPGFEGVYAVTEDGRVYCHERCNSDPHPTPEIRSRG
ncbi:NUMOD4 domain-containing protein [Escherichia coli]